MEKMKNETIFRSAEGRAEILAYYDAVLACWPLPYETYTMPTAQGETFVLASGPAEAPPLVLLHGSSANSAMWVSDVADLARGHRVYAVDIPGEPGKSEPVRYELDGDLYAGWLDAVLDGLGIERTALLGLSMGGWFAAHYAGRHPQRITRLALLCPGGIAPARLSFILRAVWLMRFERERGTERMARFVAGGQPVAEETIQYTALISRAFNPRMALPLLSDAEIAALSMPTLLIVGGTGSLAALGQDGGPPGAPGAAPGDDLAARRRPRAGGSRGQGAGLPARQ
jgi:pimeloyl-ACP methyl ester carboxylesterase